MAQEIVQNRKKYRVLTDAENQVWTRMNFLTNAQSVDNAAGLPLEQTIGAIRGVTSDLDNTEMGMVLLSSAVPAILERIPSFSFVDGVLSITLPEMYIGDESEVDTDPEYDDTELEP